MKESTNEPKSQPTPFTALGTHLKYLRELQRESLAEVSGAVEINVDNLERFEQGFERPSEDILMLMISHFDITDKEAGQLWELAGYDQPVIITQAHSGAQGPISDFKIGGKQQMLMVLALDMRTLYSDEVETSANDSGVVMNFSQSGGQAPGNAAPVARVGMSIDQARNVLRSLEQALLKAEYLRGPKQLGQGKTPKNKKDTTDTTTKSSVDNPQKTSQKSAKSSPKSSNRKTQKDEKSAE
jgi:transcriptional regulator with XRE-family HTH domain